MLKKVIVDPSYPILVSFLSFIVEFWGENLTFTCRTGRCWFRDHLETNHSLGHQQFYIVPVGLFSLLHLPKRVLLFRDVCPGRVWKGEWSGLLCSLRCGILHGPMLARNSRVLGRFYVSLSSVLIWELIVYRTFTSFFLPVSKGPLQLMFIFLLFPDPKIYDSFYPISEYSLNSEITAFSAFP